MDPVNSIRLDKWLWAARFFKTRRLASESIKAGHVLVNGQRVKASKTILVNQEITIKKSELEWTVISKLLTDKRASAPIAQTFYEETKASVQKRQALSEQKQINRLSVQPPSKKPNKHNRRKIIEFKNQI